jgi:hypothetical protein
METSEQQSISSIKSWRDLKESLSLESPDLHYFEFTTDNGSKAHLIVVDTKSKKVRLRPSVNTPTAPVSPTAGLLKAEAAVNGGYFNLSNGESASYVVVDGKTECDPHANPALMTNAKLQPYIEQVLNRTEVRFLTLKGKKSKIEICRHNDPLPAETVSVDSLQAGPQLLPELTEREEAFVRREPDGKEIDSIGCHMTAARTIFGITHDGHAMLLCVAGGKQDEFSAGVSLPDAAAIMHKLGCYKAMNFDGGTSTTMTIRASDSAGSPIYKMVVGRQPETRVKSILAVERCVEAQ